MGVPGGGDHHLTLTPGNLASCLTPRTIIPEQRAPAAAFAKHDQSLLATCTCPWTLFAILYNY